MFSSWLLTERFNRFVDCHIRFHRLCRLHFHTRTLSGSKQLATIIKVLTKKRIQVTSTHGSRTKKRQEANSHRPSTLNRLSFVWDSHSQLTHPFRFRKYSSCGSARPQRLMEWSWQWWSGGSWAGWVSAESQQPQSESEPTWQRSSSQEPCPGEWELILRFDGLFKFI